MYAYTADRRNEILARDAAQRAGQTSDLIRYVVIDVNETKLRRNWVALFRYPDRIEQTFSPGEGRSLVTNVLMSGSPLVWQRDIGE